ncbi:hypothetical protein NHP190002_15570 [Helicobacter ailurogastricus]|nr:hypothetical protein NHP190002_15570 [Helicobacter ailurogastricus]
MIVNTSLRLDDIGRHKTQNTTTPLKIEANPAFGENFAAYAGKGAEAVKKLLQEKRGQIVGKKTNMLFLKTTYKQNGKLEESRAFRDGAYIRLPKR